MKTTTIRKAETTGDAVLALCENGNGNGSRPKRIRNRAAKKQALIEAALGLFASKGYEVTTTREIAAVAGCAEGLIHRYFNGKPGLLAAIIESRVAKQVLDSGHPSRSAHDLEDEFLHLVDQEIERVWQSRNFLRVVIPRAIVDPSLGGVMNRALILRSKAIAEHLHHSKTCVGLPTGTIDVLAQAVGMLGFVFGFVRPVLLGHDRSRAKKMAATIAKTLVANSVVSVVV